MPSALPTSLPDLPSADSSTRSKQSSCSPPALQLFLTIESLVNVIKAFVVHEPVAAVLAGKSLDLSALVLERAPVHVVRHPDVQRPGLTANDVGEILVVLHGLYPLPTNPPSS